MEYEILAGNIIGDKGVLTTEELARACRAEVSWIAELIDVGILAQEGGTRQGGDSVRRTSPVLAGLPACNRRLR